jgi:hypothetical protein
MSNMGHIEIRIEGKEGNLSSLNDKDFAVSTEEKKVTKEFYQL